MEASTPQQEHHYATHRYALTPPHRYSVFRALLGAARFPTVHAGMEEEKTSMDKLKEQKLNFIVTDAEIEEYLSQETGMDRLREMFAKTYDTFLFVVPSCVSLEILFMVYYLCLFILPSLKSYFRIICTLK